MTDEPTPSSPETPEHAHDEAAAEATTTMVESAGEAGEGQEEEKQEKLVQTVEMRDIGPCKKHIKVTVDRVSIDGRLNEKFTELLKDAVIPGFRKGKAPRRVIERQYHKSVTDQVRTEILMASLQQLAEENDVAPLAQPDLNPEKIEIPRSGPLVYEFDVEVRPQFDLPNYKGLHIRRPMHTFNDDDVGKAIKRLLTPRGQLVPKEHGAVEPEDYVIADMVTKDGDRQIGKAEEITLKVEPRLAFKDGVAERFGEQVVGARPGDTRTVDIALTDRTADPSLRGKQVQAALTVKDIKQMRLPELTHELLHEFGVHSEEQLREAVLRSLERRLEYDQRQAARQQVLEQIAAAATWELPQDLLQRQAKRALGRRVMEMREGGMSDDEIRGQLRLLEQNVLGSTAVALKEHFVLQKIAEEEKIEVEEDEINTVIEAMAEQQGESPRRVRASLEKDDMLEPLAIEIIERKVLDLILDHAEYEDYQVGEPAAAVATSEEQAVPGELHDPTAEPPKAEGEGETTQEGK
jgi:trigger factor